MWTNVFKIGGLHVISWFQFLPYESDVSSLPGKSHKEEVKDAATLSILTSHIQLQNEGLLSTWTNSFVGPWDPSQGAHNPDEKIKLWLFLPGRHSSVSDSAQAAVSRLRVVGSGVWLAPGDSEEVALALSQALRNRIERVLRPLSYVRFGDVFTKCHPFASNEKNFRRMQPTFEFVFAATEEAVFIHVVVSAKHIRGLSKDDVERALRRNFCRNIGEGIPVIVSPNGMRGRITGCCSSDLVKQVYFSKVKASNGISVLGMPFHIVQSSGCRSKEQSCYVEVTMGCTSQPSSNPSKNVLQNAKEDTHLHSVGRHENKQGLLGYFPNLERTFIYPVEAVLVPVVHRAFTKSSPKRFWLHNWMGTSLSDVWTLWDSSYPSLLLQSLGFGSTTIVESMDDLWFESAVRSQQKCSSSSNSNSSSLSSTSNTSSESEYAAAVGAQDLEADADSLTCRQSGLSTNEQFDNNDRKMVSKRPRTVMTESCGQAGTVATATIQETYKSGYSVAEANNSASAVVTNDGIGSYWDLGDDDGDYGINIQSLLSEFGDFGDFFVNDNLAFGEPPGTAESQAIVVSTADFGDVNGSPCTVGMDVQDQTLLPIGLSSFESFNQGPLTRVNEAHNKPLDTMRDARSSLDDTNSFTPSGKYDYLSKSEAMMTFAAEYAAVETPTSEFTASIFRSPYLPRSKRVESSHPSSGIYLYNASPPPSPLIEASEEKVEISTRGKLGPSRHNGSSSIQSTIYYTHAQGGNKQHVKSGLIDNEKSSQKGVMPSSVSGITLSCTSLHMQCKNDNTLEVGDFLLSHKTALATEVECMMLQAGMCRIRHTLLSCQNQINISLNKITGTTFSDQVLSETSALQDLVSGRHEVKKKDTIPVRIAGDVDSRTLEVPLISPVGVWRSVGTSKGAKQFTVKVENSSSLPHNTFVEECLSANMQCQPLQGLLDAMALLVQQSTSFVDIALDSYDGEDPYYCLALQEQQRRGFSCGPSMVHAGCGGLLATCHFIDIAGVDLIDPLSADVHASFVISLLQSDIKVAIKNAFGNFDGPLSVTDWCKGRNQSGDSMAVGDGFPVDCIGNEAKDSSSAITLCGEPISPSQALTGGSSCLKDVSRMDEALQRRTNQDSSNSELELPNCYSRFRPTISLIPFPALLVGYQDDWLKTSATSIELWEKGPLEPYALPKPMTYYAVCPDIDLLSSAAADFFLQLGTVYESCKLGSHSPQVNGGGQMEQVSGKYASSGFILVDCPQSVKVASSNISAISSITDFFVALENGWDVKSFLKALTKALKTLKLGLCSTINQKESKGGPCMVVYVVCPFPEPIAILQTVVEASVALGSNFLAADKERRSILHSQVSKALSCAAAADEASISNVLMLSGFNIPKLVLQIVTVDSLLRVKPGNELAMLKEYAFTVYNKARRIPRASSTSDLVQSTVAGRSQSALMHMSSPIPALWKDCLAQRISTATLTRDSELDAALRPGSWDNSWQTVRSCDSLPQDDVRFLFEPLFILAEPCSVESGLPGSSLSDSSSSRSVVDDSGGTFIQSSVSGLNADTGISSLVDGSDNEPKVPSLHCCYGWTEDWRWLVSIWTDSRGELLDSQVFPFGGISDRQDTKLLQCLFVKMLYHGCQILSWSSDSGNIRPRDIIITRVGFFFELERQEWQKAIYSVGGNEVKKWSLQLRRSASDGIGSGNNGPSLQQQDLGSIQERTCPSSPSPLYSPHAKSNYMKSSLIQANNKKQHSAGPAAVDCSRGLFQFVLSISLVGVSIDHSLLLMQPADALSGGTQTSSNSPLSGYLEGFSPVKSLGSISASYIFIPSLSMHYLPSMPLQLPTSLTSESPPLAHLLHSKGSAIPLTNGFVVSKTVPSVRKDLTRAIKDEWPSILSVSLIDYYGSSSSNIQEKYRGNINSSSGSKQRNAGLEAGSRENELETNCVLESLAAELHSLSWMTVSPLYLERRTALPFHCDMVLRLRRLLHYADKELSRPTEAV
uniref:Mediator of RNA polymerase II transcription subunit 13 n=1 Tax=Anthurium amnicola TaxID=1678845 RepID=A0A1D1ZKE6_9ARAE